MTKVKICGITNLTDARVAADAGADLLGFIFYEPSPRYVRPEIVKDIVASFRGQVASGRGAEEQRDRGARGKGAGNTNGATLQLRSGCVLSLLKWQARNMHHELPLFVGVFVNTPLADVEQILDFCGLDAAQLHGEESPEFVAHFKGRAYKALRPKSIENAEMVITNYQLPITNYQSSDLPAFLLDAYHPTLYGGTGHVIDWTMAANIARQHSIMLAGSLTPDNVAEAIQVVRPWGVDVSSGVEAEKGRKDHDKVREFIEISKRVA